MNGLNQFLRGGLAMASLVAGLFFLRFWKVSHDRLFLFLGAAFWVLAVNWTGLGLVHSTPEARHYFYLVRLVAFLLILVGVLDKNRRRQ